MDFLRDPKKYSALGGAAPKGVLLIGAPGTGKTLLAESRPNGLVRFNFEFFKPWYCTITTDFIFRPTGSRTEVTWAMAKKNNVIAKASGLVMNMDKTIGENFEVELAKLKTITEAAANKSPVHRAEVVKNCRWATPHGQTHPARVTSG